MLETNLVAAVGGETKRTETHEDGMGGSITILQRGDSVRPMIFRMRMPKGVSPPAPEMHPSQSEEIRVLSGVLRLGIVGGRELVLGPGERTTLLAGTFHQPSSGGEEPVEFEAILTPGLASASMFTAVYSAFRGHRGLGQIVRLAVAFTSHPEVIQFRAPFRFVLGSLAAAARALRVS